MKKIWQKDTTQDTLAEAYCFGDGAILDNALISYDVYGSIAHAKMLATIGILTVEELEALSITLSEILNLAETGKFVVTTEDEDVHTKVENYLIEKLGDIGKKIHTGRSRNDQVLVDLRLYSKDSIFRLASQTYKTTHDFITFAKKYEFTPMPGYTHMQRAMPSSVGMWAGSFAESLLDDLQQLKAAYMLNDQSPLGSGAAYGVSLPLDRHMTSTLLGFTKVQNNSLYCQASRVKVQLAISSALMQIMLTLSRFAQDILLFTTTEFNFFAIDDKVVTGSSIMPQKKNIDVMEVLRARTHETIAMTQTMASIGAGLPSGYNGDFAETKQSFMRVFTIAETSLPIVSMVLSSIKPNETVMKKANTPEIYAAHAAYLLVKKGMPFRESYQKIGTNLASIPIFDPQEVISQTNHDGGPGNLHLDAIQDQLHKEQQSWDKAHVQFTQTLNKLRGGEKK